MSRICTMRQALTDPDIFGTILPGETWAAWRTVLIASQGEPLTEDERTIFRELSGREHEPDQPCDEVWGVVGRRGGKTRGFAVAAAYMAGCVDYEGKFAPGQRGRLPVMAASKDQATEAFRYLLGIFTEVPMFADMVDGEPTQDTIRLRNRVDIVVQPANFKTVRGPTLVAAVCDEIAFWHIEQAANPDREVLRALRPGLMTLNGPLFVLSSPYAKKGELYAAYRRDFGSKGDPRVLVIQAPTLAMHRSPKIEREVARAYERDAEAAKAEYGAQFREGISDFVSPEVVDACTDPGTTQRDRQPHVSYTAFIDPAGGSGQDSMTLAIGHRDANGCAVLDRVEGIAPPFSPESACTQFAAILKTYGVNRVVGDNYAAEWPKEAMLKQGISYERSDKPKGAIYAEFLPLLNSRKVRLLEHDAMRKQLCSLERRTAWGGRDTIDHPTNGHDDFINAAAGVLVGIGVGHVSIMDLL
ncbi:hypothetical protein [Methylobacterium dankookense]|uniref:Terminase large subunit gp17-like C-terminal domain-containing protein n=1 Tax=Methylobacterium dankookense TaxID=560405 RepID=A0A564G2E1_9HYPH|nr:hypothetical protein [Methylobacterium dankookense]GJD58255.1 hypothetical protein IFDJLNFL_4172 [Methylobacterium dankookense]VUF14176.1 hypothetical protein MTDSW087_03892 [Methylobacterium dankookense]